MDWLDTHSGSVQALGTLVLVAITAYYAWTSRALVRQTRASLQATARTTLQGRLDRISEILIDHPELSDALDKPAAENDATDGPSHVAHLLWAVLEEAHTQFAVDRTMPDEDWRAWAVTIDHFIHRPYLNTHWQRARDLYGDSFQSYVDERLKLPPPA
jgi:hypothetical protein